MMHSSIHVIYDYKNIYQTLILCNVVNLKEPSYYYYNSTVVSHSNKIYDIGKKYWIGLEFLK